MSMRFPRRGTGGNEGKHGASPAPAHEPHSPLVARETLATIPDHACCCTARPVVKVMMPATATRPHPVDLWLCGHHWRASRKALAQAGATAFDVSRPAAAAARPREGAAV